MRWLLTGDHAPCERGQKAHDEDDGWNEATDFVLAQARERDGGRDEVTEDGREEVPQEHLVPHLCKTRRFVGVIFVKLITPAARKVQLFTS